MCKMRSSPSTARRSQESKGGGSVLFMKIQVGIVHFVTSAHKRFYVAAFNLLIVLSKTATYIPLWSICMQNAFFSIYNETFFRE